jgi:outer membrane receptor protein involved in Fe transport
MYQGTKRLFAILGAAVFSFIVIHPGDLGAQTITGSIDGTVTDASGSPIPEVKATVSGSALISEAQTLMTNATGYYKFLQLPPGTYKVRFEKTGFKTNVVQGIVVNSAVTVTTDVHLSVGDVSQDITVSAQAATIDTEHSLDATVATQAVMEGVPTGRSPWAIANTVPAVTPTAFDVGGSSGMQQSSLTAHGSNSSDQKFMIDGVSVNWPGGGGGSTGMYYDMGMFQEVNYLVGALPADVSQGGVYMNMVTKDGGNKIHGSVFMNGASQGMQSNNVGPALAADLLKNISALARSLIQPNYIPGNPITETYDYNGQVGGALIKDKLWWFTSWRLWATNNIVAGGFNLNGTQALNTNQIADEMAKFSYQINPKNKISIMYFRNQKNRYYRRNQGSFGDNLTTVLQNQPGYDGHVKYTYVPTSRLVFDSGVDLNHIKTPYRYQADILPGAISVYDSATATVYNAAEYNYINPCYRLAVDSSVSYFTTALGGPHNFRAGVQYSHDGFNQRYTANGDLQGVLINGIPTTATLFNTPINQQKNNMDITGIYGEDTWTIKRRLTVTLGLRFERMYGSIPAQTSPAGTFVGARSYAAINGVPDFNNFTPRFGLAWDITGKGKTVLKASANRYMQGLDMNIVNAVNPLGFSTASVPWTCTTTIATCIADGPTLAQLNLSAFNGFVGGATTHLDPNLKRPYSWEESLGVSQQLPLDVIFSVTGWYRSTFDQIGRVNLDVTPADYTPVTITNPLTGAPLTVYNQLASTKGMVNYELTNSKILNTEYRGIDMMFTRHMNRHWMMQGGVTVGRNRGAFTGDANSTLDDLNNPNNNINRLGELANDSTVIFKLAGTYDLPFGIVLSGNFQHLTGYPEEGTYTFTSATLGGGQVLTQSSQSIYLVPSGSQRLPAVNLLDLRVSKIFTIKERYKLQPEFDVYNLNNSSAAVSENTSVNAATYLNPTAILPPRLFKVGLRFDF